MDLKISEKTVLLIIFSLLALIIGHASNYIFPLFCLMFLFFMMNMAFLFLFSDEHLSCIQQIRNKKFPLNIVVHLGIFLLYILIVFTTIKTALHPNYFIKKVLDINADLIYILTFLKLFYEIRRLIINSIEKKYKKLQDLLPKLINYFTPETNVTKRVKVKDLKEGDIILVPPNSIIPVDGCIITGESYIDQSYLTGDVRPIKYFIDDNILGGSKNLSHSLKIKVTKTDSSYIHFLINYLKNSLLTKGPSQVYFEKLSPTILIGILLSTTSLFLFFHFYLLLKIEIIVFFLVAFLLSLNIESFSHIGKFFHHTAIIKAGLNGIFINNKNAIPNYKKINTLIIDKSAILTSKDIKVVDFIIDDEALINNVLLMQKKSKHSFSKAITKYLNKLGYFAPHTSFEFQSVHGQGIKAKFTKGEMLIGNHAMMHKAKIRLIPKYKNIYLENSGDGKTTSFISWNGNIIGAIIFNESLVPNARELLQAISSLNINLVLVSGDNEKTTREIADLTGVDEYHSELTPSLKESVIKKHKDENKFVAFVGGIEKDKQLFDFADVSIGVNLGNYNNNTKTDIVLYHADINKLFVFFNIFQTKRSLFITAISILIIYNFLIIPFSSGILYLNYEIYISPITATIFSLLSSFIILNLVIYLKNTYFSPFALEED